MGKKIGSVKTPFGPAAVMRGTYRTADGPMAIWLEHEIDGDRIAVVSVSADGDLGGPNRFFAKTYSENEPLREPLLACGLFYDTGRRQRSGLIELEVWALR